LLTGRRARNKKDFYAGDRRSWLSCREPREQSLLCRPSQYLKSTPEPQEKRTTTGRLEERYPVGRNCGGNLRVGEVAVVCHEGMFAVLYTE